MLSERDSAFLVVNGSRRHVRLLRRYRCEELIKGIEPLITDLAQKRQLCEERVLDAQAALDAVVAADGDLDDAVRNLFDSARQHDRSNPTAPALPDLFPSGGFSSVIDLPRTDEPDAVDALAKKLDLLGSGHDLAPHAAKLREAAQAVREALTMHREAIRAQKAAEAEEDIAKSALRRKYEANYLDARKQWGRLVADRLFPNLYPSKRSGADTSKVVKGDFAEKTA